MPSRPNTIPFHIPQLDDEDLRMLEEEEDTGNTHELPVVKDPGNSHELPVVKVKTTESKASTTGRMIPSSLSNNSHSNDAFHTVMASSFASAQKAVSESHERALNLISKCMEEIHKKDKANKDLLAQLATAGTRPPERKASSTLSIGRKDRKLSSTLFKAKPTNPVAFLEDAGSSSESWGGSSLKPPHEEHGQPSAPPGSAPSMVTVAARHEDGGRHEPSKPSKQASNRGASKNSCSSYNSQPSDQQDVASRNSSKSDTSRMSPAEDVDMSKIRARRPSMASNASMQSCAVAYELLPLWSNEQKRPRKRNKMGKLGRSCSFESLGSVESMDMSAGEWNQCCGNENCKLPILNPNSAKRACWDISATLLIFYDIVMIPLLLFDLPEDTFLTLMDWTTRLFWTLDIFLSFLTGKLESNGSIEMRFVKITRGYITSWFFVDVFIVASDWIEVLWPDGSFLGFARAGKASRSFRLLRMVRLIRLARMRKLYTTFLDRLHSEQLVIIAGIIHIMLVIMGLGHVIACIWYGISNQDRHDTWLKVHNFDQAPFHYKYTTCLHWSLLQFAGGTDEIVPQNSTERIYAVGVFLLAFVMAAVFVGRLTSSMTQLHMLSRKDVERFQILRRYLAKNEITGFLSMRVMQSAQHALQENQRFMEETRVELLSIISEPLRVELHFELYSPVLAVHPFFHCFIDGAPQVMKKVCHKAMSQLLVSEGDIVFMPGEVPSPPRMIIVCSGELSYTYLNGAVAYVQAGQWISEAVLWVAWTHQGMLKAAKDCRLCILDASKFFQIADAFNHDFDIRVYARKFVACMNSGEIDHSDLPWDEGCQDLLDAIRYLSPHAEHSTSEGEESGIRRFSAGSWMRSTSEEFGSTTKPKKSVLMVTPSYHSSSKSGWW